MQQTDETRLAIANIEEKLKQEEQIAFDDLIGFSNDKNIIGAGAFGEVRKVSWRKCPAAAKVAKHDLSQEEKDLFLRELNVLTRCRHPNIVQFLGYVDTPFVIVMEWLPMGDLKQYWKKHNVPRSHKIQICIDVLRALAYLHNRRPTAIIHRDIKPTNVLITKSGVAKLTDFGLGRFMAGEPSTHRGQVWMRSPSPHVHRPARTSKETDSKPKPVMDGASDGTVTASGSEEEEEEEEERVAAAAYRVPRAQRQTSAPCYSSVVGTAPYMAPEANLDKYDEKLDIFSAAVTFYELFEQASFDESLPFAWGVAPTKVRPLIKRMGSQDPTERPSALELIDLFDELTPKAGGKSLACVVC